MSPHLISRAGLAAVLVATLLLAGPARPAAAPAADGEMRWALHVTLAAKWLDPAETEAVNTPYMVLYAVHDALVRPMPAGLMMPSLAVEESGASLIPGYAYSAPMEDLRLKK